jgi:RNA polymerase sigma-70 factor (ECF subfamily)
LDEAALVGAARQGDREAFMQLVGLHQAGVRAFVHGMLSDPVLAEDIAQEAFLRAWRGLGGFRGEAAFGSWLYAIARRAALDEVRRPAVVTVPVEEAWGLADERAGDPVLRGDLERGLRALEPAQREAFLLVAVLGLSYREVGGMVGQPGVSCSGAVGVGVACLGGGSGVTVHEHVQQPLSAMLDGQDDPDLVFLTSCRFQPHGACDDGSAETRSCGSGTACGLPGPCGYYLVSAPGGL